MSRTPIQPGTRKDRKDLPAVRQDSTTKYAVTEAMRAKGSIKGKFPVHIPSLKMTIYTKYPERAEELREKYLNRPLFGVKEIVDLK